MKHIFRAIIWALSLCLLPMVVGCTAGGDARLGEAVATAFFTVQADEVLLGGDTPAAPELPGPPEGYEYIWVKIAITADADLMLYYDDFDLEADGVPLFPERVVCAQQLPEEQLLQSGQSAVGYLVYAVPSGVRKLRLIYTEYYEGDLQGDTHAVRLK